LNSKKLWNGTKKRKVLIIDEVTLFDAGRLQALTQLASREGGII